MALGRDLDWPPGLLGDGGLICGVGARRTDDLFTSGAVIGQGKAHIQDAGWVSAVCS